MVCVIRVAKMTATMSPVIVVVIATAVTYKIHKDNVRHRHTR